ncbi:MAG: S9 family peptidase, partial [Clostridia bacterium]|nr:S9 family peptidase [Clostridia bacterium]
MKKIEINSFLDFRFVSAPEFAPDQRSAAFLVQQASLEENRYRSDLWLLDVESKAARQLTAGGDVKDYAWLPDGTLLFPALREESLKKKAKDEPLTAWYQIDPRGGEATLAFTLKLKATKLTVLDGDRYVITATQENAPKDKEADWEVLDEAPFWFNGKGFTNGKRSRLYLYTRSTDTLTPLTSEWFDTTALAVRGETLLYKGLEWRDFKKPALYDGFYLYHATSGETRELIAPGTIRTGAFDLWDETSALVAASDNRDYGNNRYHDFYTLDLATGALTLLAPYEASIGSGSVGSDARLGGGKTLRCVHSRCYFVTTVNDHAYLRCIDREGTLSELLTPDGSCDSFDVANSPEAGGLLYCGLYGDKLAELYLYGEQVTHFNDEWTAAHTVSTPEPHTFTASDGFEIHGWALKPAGYVAGQKYPAILHIHGGPRTVFGEVFHHEMQVWANAGYFVLFSNPRGSDGRGNEFGFINGKYGTVDYDNLMEFTDEMLKKYPDIDPARVGVTGGSYGGFMTNWIIGHTDRVAVAATQRSISNWTAFEHTADIGVSFTPDNQGSTTALDVDKLWWHSPLKYAD